MTPTAKNPPTIQQARAAKLKAEALLSRNTKVNGIGLTRFGKGWCVKVNLSGPTRAVLPEEIDGVPLRIEQVGEITRR